MQRHVLILEDDEQLAAQLLRHMQSAGLCGRLIPDGRTLTEEDLEAVELVVLDLMLPSKHGFDVLKHLRTFSDVPVLILSARGDAEDKIRGFKLGADDYMTKPFWPEELVERVKARLRRPILQRDDCVEVANLRIDRARREVFVSGNQVQLTRAEFELLCALAERPGAAVTRRSLVLRIFDEERDGDERALDVHVSRVRKKLGTPSPIETVWGIGYRIALGKDA